MSSPFGHRRSVLVCLLVLCALALANCNRGGRSKFAISPDYNVLPANGYATTRINVTTRNLEPSALAWTFDSGRELAEIETKGPEVHLRAGVNPGLVTLIARAPGFPPARATIQLSLDPTDQFGDGTPDFLRLDSKQDQIAFRRWFAFLAESAYFQKEKDRPAEINDCAALIRFAYREALRKHDPAWANQWRLPQSPNAQSVEKYEYPRTPMTANLFRTRAGAFAPEDLANGTFAQFADAKSLRRFNSHLVSRQLSAARPGDLLFFRQEGHRMPFHVMIYLGNSSFTDGADWIIYHTGPSDGRPGELRRVTVTELLSHPQFCWRPLPQNPAFLGIYRWNILREED